jgi:flavorubredoxin
MIARELITGVYALTAQDWDRKRFDELVPLPEGTSYNAYLVKGSDKIALIDTVHPSMAQDLVAALQQLGLPRIDYIVANHAELDHAGAIPAVLAAYPQAQVLANAKCRSLLAAELGLPREMFVLIQDNHTLSLGDRSLRFMWMPWVHWPDSTATYLEPDHILFSCDFLGAHLACSELLADDEPRVEQAARMYYAEIMMPFRKHVVRHLERLAAEDIAMIAPGHGPVHARPAFILDLYRRWAADTPQPEIVIPYISMYDSTRRMVDHLLDRLMAEGLKVQPFNVVELDSGRFASALVEASTLVFASPLVLDGPHPAMANAAFLVNALKPKVSHAAIIGSYGWGTALAENLQPLLSNLHAEWLAPVIVGGVPKEADFAALDGLAARIVQVNRAEGV